MSTDPRFPEAGGLADRFKEIERRLTALERSDRLTSASVGSGGIKVKDDGSIQFLADNGTVILEIDKAAFTFDRANGVRQLEITPAGGMRFYEADGSTVIATIDGDGVDIGAGKVTLDETGLEVDGGQVVATFTDVQEATASGLTLTATFTEFATVSFALPAWVATAKIMAWAQVTGSNSTGGSIGIMSSCRINDVDDGAIQNDAAASSNTSALHIDEATIDTSIDGFNPSISVYGRRNGGSNISAVAAVWGIVIGYAT